MVPVGFKQFLIPFLVGICSAAKNYCGGIPVRIRSALESDNGVLFFVAHKLLCGGFVARVISLLAMQPTSLPQAISMAHFQESKIALRIAQLKTYSTKYHPQPYFTHAASSIFLSIDKKHALTCKHTFATIHHP